jgi:hypothetical protein
LFFLPPPLAQQLNLFAIFVGYPQKKQDAFTNPLKSIESRPADRACLYLPVAAPLLVWRTLFIPVRWTLAVCFGGKDNE